MRLARAELKRRICNQELSAAQFCELPLSERLRVVLERRVAFFLGSQPVESLAALRALRERTL